MSATASSLFWNLYSDVELLCTPAFRYFSAPPSMYFHRSAAAKVRVAAVLPQPSTSLEAGKNAASVPAPRLQPVLAIATAIKNVAQKVMALGRRDLARLIRLRTECCAR